MQDAAGYAAGRYDPAGLAELTDSGAVVPAVR